MHSHWKIKYCLIAIVVLLCLYRLRYSLVEYPYFPGKLDVVSLNLNEVGQSIYVERLEHLNKVCKTIRGNLKKWDRKDVYDHIIVDKKHRLLYCYVPKVACTNWKRIFVLLKDNSSLTDALQIPAQLAHSRNTLLTLNNYTKEEADHFLKTFTKFLFVRHPFERLLSAFKNKLETNYIQSDYFQKRVGKVIIEKYRLKNGKQSRNRTEEITFDEFTKYLTKSQPSSFNEHWKPISSLCEPCKVKFDFIGKYETIDYDSTFILQKIGLDYVKFPHSGRSSRTSSQLKNYFSSLPKLRIKQLFSLYKYDFKMFSYSLADLLGYEVGL